MEMKTRMTMEWIGQALQQNPCTKLESGLIRTCPVRLSFPQIFKGKAMKQGEDEKFSAALLFPAHADITVLQQEVLAKAQDAFGDCFRDGQYAGGLTLPFRDQGDKAKFDGYVPGAVFFTASSKFKPAIVDAQLAPILDEARVYPGVWALCTLNVFTYRQEFKRGVSFGLNSVMVVQDDESLGGGGSDPNKDFAGVQVSTATNFDPAGQFGVAAGTGAANTGAPATDPQAAARAALGL